MTEKTISNICAIAGCENPGKARGWCGKHHQRWLRDGDPLITRSRGDRRGFDPVANFWRRVDKARANRCWEWQGYRMRLGYGQVTFKSRQYRTHRLAWILTYGKEPEGCLLHSCDNPPCCNPAHLREGSRTDNASDRVKRNRQAKGEQFSDAKLTEANVLEIRERIKNGERQPAIARRFGVSQSAVSAIKLRKRWAHVVERTIPVVSEIS